MKAIIKSIIGPYDGPFEKNIITYKLNIGLNCLIWHENGKRSMSNLKLKVGDVISGIVLKDNKIDYSKSKITKTQLNLEL
jgi:hypothetical protein